MAGQATIAFWNLKWNGKLDREIAFLANNEVRWDVLALAEVTPSAFEELLSALPGVQGVSGLAASGGSDAVHPHGVAVLVRNGFSLGEAGVFGAETQDAAPRPERWLLANVAAADAEFVVGVWHAPNAVRTADKRLKRATYMAMTEWLVRHESRLVLAMDGNNWWEADGQPRSTPRHSHYYEHRFHEIPSSHGLVDSLPEALRLGRAVVQSTARCLAPTYLGAKEPHRMDRIYATPDLEVLGAGVSYGGRPFSTLRPGDVCAGSDHALVWASFEL